MRLILFVLLFVSGVFLFTSCQNDFDVNADWKEVTIVYGLLEANKDTQYIKINKAFLNENTSAIELAQRMDSLYHSDSITVVLDEMVNGSRTKEVFLIKDTFLNKEPGDFHYPENILYRTPSGFTVNTSAEYFLRVINKAKGTETLAQTTVVAPVRHVYPAATQKRINFGGYSLLQLNFRSGTNARFYDFEVIFNYKEYPRGNPSEAEEKSLTWKVFDYRTITTPASSADVGFKLPTEEFYKFVSQKLPADGMVRESDSIKFVYSAGGDEIYNYLTINNTSIGLVQKRADYTNVTNGYGIFSSRLREEITMRLSDDSIDSLISGIHTRDLGFIQ